LGGEADIDLTLEKISRPDGLEYPVSGSLVDAQVDKRSRRWGILVEGTQLTFVINTSTPVVFEVTVEMKDRDTPGDLYEESIEVFSSCKEFTLKQLSQHEYASVDLDRLGRLDWSCGDRMSKHEREKPERPTEISLSVFPRYGQLRADLARAWAKHRVVQLNQPLRMTQRISPTVVMAGPFYAQAAQFAFCDDGVCQYNGPILVHLAGPSLAQYLMPDMRLQYIGLKTYTTVLGASETIPEFRQVEAKQFPDVFDAYLKFDQFKPTPEETQALAAATEKDYEQRLIAWVTEGIQIESTYLAGRLQLVKRILKPWIGVHRYLRLENGMGVSDEVPESAGKMLPGLTDKYEKTIAQLLRVLELAQGQTGQSREGTDNAARIYEYTKGWLRLNLSQCGSDKPLSPRPAEWAQDPSTYRWDVFQCWATPRFELPRMPEGQSSPPEPPWWSNYVSNQESLLDHSHDRP
jgi:hypothetical protein